MATAVRTKRHDYAVGQILVSSWGYDQTNIDFYVVTRVSNASVWLYPLGKRECEATSGMSRTVTAIDTQASRNARNNQSGVCHRVTKSGGVKVGYRRYAMAWNGRPMHESWWA